MNRDISVIVDDASWAPGPVPSEIASLGGRWSCDVRRALISTAFCTRPPKSYGFHLSDCWALFRYSHAVSNSSELRLRSEWDSIDPHQKTVLSDDLGIGFTTWLLSEKLGCREFTDTLYVLKVLMPGSFSLLSSKKTGPKKSPDYIGRDALGNYVVLECKGTQRSIQSLRDALERGRTQKQNLRARRRAQQPIRIRHSLVAGLFIPQWTSSEPACIIVADPEWDEIDEVLSAREPDEIDASIVQVALAKGLSLAGLHEPADVLAETPTADLRVLPSAAREALGQKQGPTVSGLNLIFDSADRFLNQNAGPMRHRTRFYVEAPAYIIEALRDADAVWDVLTVLAKNSRAHEWKWHEDAIGAEVQTPLGFRFRLEID